MLDAFETGRATLDQYLHRTVFYREHAFTPADFKAFMFEQSQAYPEPLAFLGKIARMRRFLVASLNNESREINEYRIEKFKLRDYFEAFFSSCYLGVRKPDPGIYGLALKITQQSPAECILIDDRGLNLECAREVGMQTILFKDLAQLRADLAHFDILIDGK
jgi:putative hydrolase of the HAD superfamily